MCGNPFKIGQKVDGKFEVDKVTTSIDVDGYDISKLRWNEHEGYDEYLSLNEILKQIKAEHQKKDPQTKIPLIKVDYESALWGVIFEVGNCLELGEQWIVHGITKGYA